jgi:hypothetical protein
MQCQRYLMLNLFQNLNVLQLKRLSSFIDEWMKQSNEDRAKCEVERTAALVEIGNLLHESVIISDNEVCLCLSCITCYHIAFHVICPGGQ